MPLHRLLKLRLGGVLQALQLRVERVELEEVAMAADRGAGAAVRLLSPIIGALHRACWQCALCGVLRTLRRGRWNVVHDPVHVHALRLGGIWRVGIVDDENEAARSIRCPGPLEWRGDVGTFARVLRRNGAAGGECGGWGCERQL